MADETENDVVDVTETEITKETKTEKPVKQDKQEKAENRPSDGEAKLLKELMKLKNTLKDREDALSRYGDIDADTVKSMLEEKKQKEDELRVAEEKRLRDAGDFDALKKSMGEQHARELKAQVDALQAERNNMGKLQRTIEELTVGQSFGNSTFLRDETLLTPAKARKLYGDYFDTENGVIRPYSKERGESGREPMVTSSGDPLSFDEAMRRIIEADPDRERLLRSKAKAGTGSVPSPGKTPPKSDAGPGAGIERIKAALNKGK